MAEGRGDWVLRMCIYTDDVGYAHVRISARPTATTHLIDLKGVNGLDLRIANWALFLQQGERGQSCLSFHLLFYICAPFFASYSFIHNLSPFACVLTQFSPRACRAYHLIVLLYTSTLDATWVLSRRDQLWTCVRIRTLPLHLERLRWGSTSSNATCETALARCVSLLLPWPSAPCLLWASHRCCCCQPGSGHTGL